MARGPINIGLGARELSPEALQARAERRERIEEKRRLRRRAARAGSTALTVGEALSLADAGVRRALALAIDRAEIESAGRYISTWVLMLDAAKGAPLPRTVGEARELTGLSDLRGTRIPIGPDGRGKLQDLADLPSRSGPAERHVVWCPVCNWRKVTTSEEASSEAGHCCRGCFSGTLVHLREDGREAAEEVTHGQAGVGGP